MIVPELTDEQRALVDEYAEVRKLVKSWQPNVNPHMARFLALGAAIQSWLENLPADQEIVATGYLYDLPLTARRKSRSLIRVTRLYKRLGIQWVIEHCRPTLADVEHAIPAGERATLIRETRDGPRAIGEPVWPERQARSKAA